MQSGLDLLHYAFGSYIAQLFNTHAEQLLKARPSLQNLLVTATECADSCNRYRSYHTLSYPCRLTVSMVTRTSLVWAFTVILTVVSGTAVSAQEAVSAYHIALGGGTAFVTGPSAHFRNPANIILTDPSHRHHITLGTAGLYHSHGLAASNAGDLPGETTAFFVPEDLSSHKSVSETDLDMMFGNSDRFSRTHSIEVVPLTYTWADESRGYSLAWRSRGISSFEMNRNWFDNEAVDSESPSPFTRYLNENYQVLHEISFAMAREVTMLNRWQAGLNTLYIGLAPKLVLGGMHSEMRYRSDLDPVQTGWQSAGLMEARASGDISLYMADLLRSSDAEEAFRNHMEPSSNLGINGAGFGLDAGLTYIIPLGDDISLSPHHQAPLRKSLRLSVALTDIGAVRYHGSPSKWQSREVRRTYDELPRTLAVYSGKPGDFFRYIQEESGDETVLDNLAQVDDQPYFIQLPTELHMGTAFQYNWITTVANMNYRLNSPDFNAGGWRFSLGADIRLLRFLPVMGSVQWQPDSDITFGMGAGLDLGLLKAFGAVRFIPSPGERSGLHVNNLSTLTLQISF